MRAFTGKENLGWMANPRSGRHQLCQEMDQNQFVSKFLVLTQIIHTVVPNDSPGAPEVNFLEKNDFQRLPMLFL